MILIYTGQATSFTNGLMTFNGKPIGYILPILFTLILLVKHPIKFDKKIVVITIVYIIWLALQYIKQDEFYLNGITILYNIFIAFALIKLFDAKLFLLYEKYLVTLSIVALIGWSFHTLIPQAFTTLMKHISIQDFSQDNTISANIIIFSLSNVSRGELLFGLFPRNSGFSWEPGRFASLVIIAILFNGMRTKFAFKNNRNLFILISTLLTTLSTTGYIALFVLLIASISQKKISGKILSIAIIIPFIFMSLSLPFLTDKINNLWVDSYSDSTTLENADWIVDNREKNIVMPQRITSLFLECQNIPHDLILGYGIDRSNSFVSKNISEYLVLPNGTLKVFSQFGLILGLAFYLILYRSSAKISSFYNSKNKWLYIFLYIIISFSYNFITVPLFLAFWMYGLNPKIRWLKGINYEAKI